jgi:3'(2'), 5'-bisphosphate nucleotidase
MDTSEFRRLAEGLLQATLAAAQVQMAHLAAGVAVETKADRSPVTIADQRSEEIILEALARLAPGVAVIAEEAVTAGRIPSITGPFFLVDPLDGTKGFIKGKAEFTINVALIEERVPVFGLLYAPALADFYVTLAPTHAVNARIEPRAKPDGLAQCDLVPIRTRVPDPNALASLTSSEHLDRATTRLLDSFGVIDRRAVSSSLKFGLLAKGEADLYPRMRPTSEWDTAAGHAVLSAAGGSVTRVDGSPLLYGKAEQGFENPDFIAWGRGPLPKRRQAEG